MEQFITDWFVEIIVFCLMGLFIVFKVLIALGKQSEERRQLWEKHYIKETKKKLEKNINNNISN